MWRWYVVGVEVVVCWRGAGVSRGAHLGGRFPMAVSVSAASPQFDETL